MTKMRPASAAGFLSALLLTTAPASFAETPKTDWDVFGRNVLKQLIEVDSTHVSGSTGLTHLIAERLITAGFSKDDFKLLAPPDHPIKGNIVVRLKGTGKLKPVLFICHLDVVEADKRDWTYDPFKLTENDGWLYGRGTIDMKGQDASTLTALIRLKADGYKPDRDIIVAFTADEEAGGDANGVEWLMKNHRDLLNAEFVINPDSGDAASENGKKVYLGVQTSEKQYMTFGLEGHDKGGHSSEPTPANPIYHMAAGLDRLAHYQFPLNLTPTAKAYFGARAKLETGQLQADMYSVAGPSPDPAAVERLSSTVDTNVIMRTTCVATEISGGRSESALPEIADSVIQCRVVPGESEASVEKAIADAVADPSIKLSEIYPPDISPESAIDPRIFGEVDKLGKEMWGGLPVLPEMSAGASDSAFTRAGGIPSYGVDGIFQDLDDQRAHGKDERVGIEAYKQELEFSYRLMKDLGKMK
jgi:acetylornithine deacetylase/succinyl-diaminopimelate desuccinylase-like protein